MSEPNDAAGERVELGETVFVGRTIAEYEALFDLGDALTGETVLDCPGGACTFTALANDRGVDATAVDPVYGRPPAEVAEQVERGVERLRETFLEAGDHEQFCWDYYDDPATVLQGFERAGERFLDDYRDHWRTDRYQQAMLPDLPFADDAFDRVLSGHLLCLYGERFSYEFHEASLRELCRVSRREVRVAPVTEQRRARRYRHLDRLCAVLDDAGYTTRLEASRLPFFSADPAVLVVEC